MYLWVPQPIFLLFLHKIPREHYYMLMSGIFSEEKTEFKAYLRY